VTLTRRSVARSVDELLAGATSRERLKTLDSKSGADFERIVVDGTSYVVKHFTTPDWLAEGSRDTTCRSVTLFEDGVYDAVDDIVDSAVVGAARLGVGSWPAALLMRDASADFVPVDAAIDLDTHRCLLGAMAGLHARFWESPPDTTYMPLAVNYEFLSPRRAVIEREMAGDRSDVLRAVGPGWAQVAAEAPAAWSAVAGLLDDPGPLVAALGRGPSTFVHGDWKMGNLGRRGDGQVVLVDWDRPMAASPTVDLGWYVAVNCDRLPESKDASLVTYRQALERRGVATGSWWDEQVELGLLGAFVQLGWSKAGQPGELAWWNDLAVRGAGRL
jgi:phosphotransferase family enzyme